jgi:hypothetical protein
MATRTTDETGREILVHDSGLIQDASNGQIVKGPDKTPITENPRGMLQRRNEISKQIAADAIDEAAFPLEPRKWGTGDGWRQIVLHTARVYLDSKNLRGMPETFAKLGTAAGYLSSRDEGQTPAGGITGTPESIRQLLVILDEEIQIRVAKAQAIEAE